MADLKDNWKNFTVENDVYKGPNMCLLNKYKSLGELIWVSVKSHGDKISYLDACTDETVTYTELQDKMVRCALWLQKQGIKSDDVISICTDNQINSIVPCLSAAYINAIFNPWNENMDLQTTLYFLQLTTPKVIFCNEKSESVILSAMKEQNYNSTVVVFGKHADAISFSDILNSCNDTEVANFRYVELDDIKKTACIMHSSGSTGMPKGVKHSNYAMLIYLQNNILALSNNAPLLWFSPLYWMSGVNMNLYTVVYGSKAIVCPKFDEEMTYQLIEKYNVQFIFFSTSLLHRFLKADCIEKYSLSSLKMVMSAGSVLKSKVQGKLRRILPHVYVLQGYGMTELCGAITLQLPNHKNGSCGTIAKNMEMKIVDPEAGKVLGPNHSGEIWIKSIVMMTGYYRNPEATKDAVDEEGWLHSGDIGYIDEDGELFITDRIKELIKYKGYQVSPAEIEGVLITHPAVLEAAVIGVPHTIDDEHPLAYITKKPGAKVTEQELIDFVAKNMMDNCKLRGGVIFLDSFPYTGSGKISKKNLKAMTIVN